MKSIVCFTLCFFICCVSFAQYKITGKVISKNKAAVEFATVSIFPINDSLNIAGIITDQSGAFEFINIKPETFQLTVQMLGYKDWGLQLDVTNDQNLGYIILMEQAIKLSEVEVVAQQSVLENHLGKKVLRIGLDLGATGSNALEALERIPSVTTTQKGDVQIRGSSNVIIYINGKETKREPSTLKFISAESLAKIEVITNPSAKYDAEGVGGIVNLVYKKDSLSALKLETISNVSFLSNPFVINPEGGINASVSKNKVSIFTNTFFEYNRYTEMLNVTRSSLNNEFQRNKNETVQDGNGLVGNVNVGLSFDPDTSLSLGLDLNYNRWDLLSTTQQESILEYKTSSSQVVNLVNGGGELEDELWVNFSLEKELNDEQILKISLSAGGEDEVNFMNNDEIDGYSSTTNIQQFIKSSAESEKQRYYQGQMDYVTPFSKWGKIETGMKADFIHYAITQNVRFQSSEFEIPNNDYQMDMQKLGAYLLQSGQLKKIEYSLGVRTEQFESKAIQRSNQSRYKQNYLRFFPSAQLNYSFSNKLSSIGFAYTKQINRPGFFALNPFASYEDPLNIETGNPALEPEIAALYELNYRVELSDVNIDITLYSRKVSDVIQTIITPIDNNRSLASTANIGEEKSRGVEGLITYNLHKKLKTTSVFELRQVMYSNFWGEISYNKQLTCNMRFTQKLQLKNNWKVVLTEIYRTPSYQTQERLSEVFYVDFGVQKKLNNKKGSFSISVRDIFNTRRDVYSLLSADLKVERGYKWQTRQVNVGFRYLIFNRKNS